MAALQCEICGGKLVGRPGGLFECEYCGMQYDKTRIQEMVQEIKGTVKVEGTVQVSGTVKLDGPVKVEDSVETQKLLRHGWLAIEDEDWDKASAYFDRVLEREPESGEAYFGKFHSRYKCQRGQHNQIGLRKMNPALSAEAKNVLRFGTDEMKAIIREIGEDHDRKNSELNEKLECQRREREEEQRIKEENLRREQERAYREKLTQISQRHNNIRSTRKLIQYFGHDVCIALNEHGRLYTSKDSYYDGQIGNLKEHKMPDLTRYKNVVSFDYPYILSADGSLFHAQGGLRMRNVKELCEGFVVRYDGTVQILPEECAAHWKGDYCKKVLEDVANWTDICTVVSSTPLVIGLRNDGTVLSSDHTINKDLKNWKNISSIHLFCGEVIGLQKNGNVVACLLDEDDEDITTWTDILDMYTGHFGVIGLRKDGSVVYCSNYTDKNKISFKDWRDVVEISPISEETIIGITLNGDMYCTGKEPSSYWAAYKNGNDVVGAYDLGGTFCYVKSDGSIHADPSGFGGISVDVGKWKLFSSVDMLQKTIDGRCVRAREELQVQRQERKKSLEKERENLKDELTKLKGLFAGFKRKDIEYRLEQIEFELKGL